MNNKVITFNIPKVKHRNHFVLFSENSPFKPKKVERKDGYKRKPKFVNKDANWQ